MQAHLGRNFRPYVVCCNTECPGNEKGDKSWMAVDRIKSSPYCQFCEEPWVDTFGRSAKPRKKEDYTTKNDFENTDHPLRPVYLELQAKGTDESKAQAAAILADHPEFEVKPVVPPKPSHQLSMAQNKYTKAFRAREHSFDRLHTLEQQVAKETERLVQLQVDLEDAQQELEQVEQQVGMVHKGGPASPTSTQLDVDSAMAAIIAMATATGTSGDEMANFTGWFQQLKTRSDQKKVQEEAAKAKEAQEQKDKDDKDKNTAPPPVGAAGMEVDSTDLGTNAAASSGDGLDKKGARRKEIEGMVEQEAKKLRLRNKATSPQRG